MRIGYAQDIHKLVEGRKLILAGVEIPNNKGLLGHSDADVIIHAFSEAILGALALGDLGTHFPDTDPKYKDIDSKVILLKVVSLMKERGYEINNADISVLLEKPKLAPYIPIMRENLAKIVNTSIDNISLKACTNEGQDSIGAGNACLAIAIVLLRRIEK